MPSVKPLANEFRTVVESPEPSSLFCNSPGIARLPGGRLVVTMDLMGKQADWLYPRPTEKPRYGKIFTSDDRGTTWQHRADFPFYQARPFVAGRSLYVLGQAKDLMIIRSDDDGETWTAPVALTEGTKWHQAPCNVHYANGHVYLVMEKLCDPGMKGWAVGILAPVLLRGRTSDDLTRREHWTFASELAFRDAADGARLDYFGVPFQPTEAREPVEVAPGRKQSPIGWLETNVVQFVREDHYWCDPSGRTFHLWMRAHTGGTGFAAIAKVVEQADGTMTTMPEKAPSGKTMLYVPCPGGHLKFHIVYDDRTRLYWLVSSQARDSMTRAERLPADRYGLPNNERDRLQLHFSTNCIDWCFAGIVAAGESHRHSRQYPAAVIDGDDLHIVSRSGNGRSPNAHDVNLISFHTVVDFRSLAY